MPTDDERVDLLAARLDVEPNAAELAALSNVEYALMRIEEAAKLNIGVGVLDEEVKKLRQPKNTGAGASMMDEEPEPWPHDVNGVELLNEIQVTLKRYIVMPEHSHTALSLWVLFTYCFDVFYSCPLILITSPTKKCGKTRCISLLTRLVSKPIPASSISESSLFRTVEKWAPTLLIDEADTFLKEKPELRGLINAGFNRDLAYVIRTVEINGEHTPQKFSTWCPKAIAQIGQPPDTITDRSIAVPMHRKTAVDQVTRFRGKDLFTDICRKCMTWAQAHREALAVAEPELFETSDDRALDKWEPLLAIADAVGGEWPDRARATAKALTGDEEDDGIKAQLLADIREAFGERNRISSAELIGMLVALEDRPWATWGRTDKPMTPNALARQLKPYKVKPEQFRDGEKTRGYTRKSLEKVWHRYLPPSQTVQAVQASNGKGFDDSQSGTREDPVPVQNTPKPASDKGSTGCTGSYSGNGGTTPRLAEMVEEAAARFNAASGANLTGEALAGQVDFDDPEQMTREWLFLYARNVWESQERKKSAAPGSVATRQAKDHGGCKSYSPDVRPGRSLIFCAHEKT